MKPRLRVLVVGGPMYDHLYATIGSFAERERVEIELVRAKNHSDLNRRITEEFSQGGGFDLLSTHSKFAPAQKQWLQPLDDWFDPGELAAFDPMALELARIEGQLYGLPRNLDVKLLHYRTDRLDNPPRTWEALVEVARTQRPYGFVFPGKGSGLFGHFFELCGSAGHYLYEPDPPRPRARHEAARWALSLLAALYRTGPAGLTEWEFDEVTACFAAGEASLTTDWPGSFHRYLQSPIRDHLGLAPYPSGPVRRAVYAGSHTFALAVRAADRPLALALLRYLTSKESQLLEARQGTFPARRDALEAARAEAPPGSLATRRWALLEESLEHAWFPPKHPRYPQVEGVVWQNLRAFLRGEQDAKRTLERIDLEGQRAAEA
ncbi:MAG: extracellular solute-binding protein [Meiothermus sp.]|uniref:extracellular solute-binding protein n=1 Tax=Meiothermus sp. TaxID=1955249 RepID=UPI0025CEE01A|nr:extracellular solute-binding protein [Meiothermus sp.]MCS7057495.1 extracellular solute-binding protein [Meiothermus sp.]MCX7739583.1 extracellular solute-binding protein [Meiothermus sp.]MDW8482458.1 extracellular solute-binding protein [Meiothermus sp.]